MTSLYHHGIKGQKWGVRRYQNLDGTLTEAGKKHYTKVAIRTYNRRKLADHPITKDAAKRLNLKDKTKKLLDIELKILNEEQKSHKYKQLIKQHEKLKVEYNKALDKAVESIIDINKSTKVNKVHKFLYNDNRTAYNKIRRAIFDSAHDVYNKRYE